MTTDACLGDEDVNWNNVIPENYSMLPFVAETNLCSAGLLPDDLDLFDFDLDKMSYESIPMNSLTLPALEREISEITYNDLFLNGNEFVGGRIRQTSECSSSGYGSDSSQTLSCDEFDQNNGSPAYSDTCDGICSTGY